MHAMNTTVLMWYEYDCIAEFHNFLHLCTASGTEKNIHNFKVSGCKLFISAT